MNTYNRVTIRGYVGADPTLKYIDPSTPVARFSVATDADGYVSSDGHFALGKVTEWHTVFAYYRLAEVTDATVFKGLFVEIEGRLSYTTIRTPGKPPRKTAYIIADKISVISREKEEEIIPEKEMPNNPYGAYLDVLEKDAETDIPF